MRDLLEKKLSEKKNSKAAEILKFKKKTLHNSKCDQSASGLHIIWGVFGTEQRFWKLQQHIFTQHDVICNWVYLLLETGS